MNYPLISEYKESILNAEENFGKLADLRPVLDGRGNPVMSSGNFAVVFKMTDGKKDYAIKCFTKDQEGREEAYRQICDYLPCVPSQYMVRTEYMEKELFVDTKQSDDEEFPVLKMDWVDGISLDRYIKDIRDDQYRRIRLADEFRGMAFWLLGQEFAHGDLKPDNIIVTDDGRLVLVDYDGMFVPSMSGQEARELGTPLYRYKGRTLKDFDVFADDYACTFIMMVLAANCIEPMDFDRFTSSDVKDILQHFAPYMEHRQVAPYIAAFLLTASCGRLDRQVLYPLLSHRSTGMPPLTVPQPQAPKRNDAHNISQTLTRTFTVNGVSFEMIPIEGGTFTMGATPEQGSDASGSEKPAHQVTLSSYAIGKYEVTQALWTAVMGNNPSRFKGDNLPVEQVSWDDCQKFIKKLNSLTGQNFRLPTEAEREFAARGGGKSNGYKYSGSNDWDEVAWYWNNSGSKTHAVGTKKPNELGIYDMSGNVWEWCNDWSGDYQSTAVTNPTGPSSGISRVFRGGSWNDDARCCRVSRRSWCSPDYRVNDMGLRLALLSMIFNVNGVSFEMIPVEGGTFTMGATPEQGSDAYDWEKPAHKVTLSSYAIGKYEVTQALWTAVMGNNPSKFKGDDLPVECVSWYDCREFIKKLNSLTGQKFRLPTEAEWEFAARGGRKSKGYKYSGSNDLDEVAWYRDNSGYQTHAVGTKKPNELGIYDMSGNVLEWCNDPWQDNYQPYAVTDPSPVSGRFRVNRGGSWNFTARFCRVSLRDEGDPGYRGDGLGLRLALQFQQVHSLK